jgi:hypothetical protein
MTFEDSILQEHYERAIALMSGIPVELRQVCALMDACGFFRQTDGEQGPRVREAIYHLTEPELRPALRQWFGILCANETNAAAMKFRQKLGEIIGETL